MAWLPSAATFLINRAQKMLPEEIRPRFAEEWHSHLNDIPGGISKMVYAAGLARAARRISANRGFRRPSFLAVSAKRLLDLATALMAVSLLSPLIFMIAALIRIDSPGPIFFSSRRVGRGGRPFTIWKFRTMSTSPSEALDACQAAAPKAHIEWWRQFPKIPDHFQVTPIGRLLRLTSLDELPQLWNVLIGSMSLVGPHPLAWAEVERYGDSFADYCEVKPGLTGLWQISDCSGMNYQERVQFDRKYARTWSLHGDLLILARTIIFAIRGI
jgi:lipopolysaccharide/colanic/teichoic acid biosynthesis glycosyltransferase